MRMGVAWKLFFIAVALVAALTTSLTYHFIREDTKAHLEELDRLGAALAGNLAYDAEYPLLIRDAGSLAHLAAGTRRIQDVAYVAILDKDGAALAEAGEPGRDESPEISVPVLSAHREEGSGEAALFPSAAEPGDTRIGTVRIVLSRDSLKVLISRLERHTVGVATLAILIAAAGIFLAVRLVLTRPLGPLMTGIAALEKGVLSHRIADAPDDELGELSRGFNRMADALSKTTVSEDYMDAIIGSMVDCLAAADAMGIIRRVNPAMERLLGTPPGTLLGRPLKEIAPDAGSDAPGQKETKLLRPDGTKIPVLLTASPIRSRGRFEGTVYVAQDLTKRKQEEEARSRAAKLESVGLLAGGIAHDFNNQLTAILGNVSILKYRISPDDPGFGEAEAVEKACIQAQRLTQQLLTFSKGGYPVKESSSVRGLIEETVRFTLTGSNIEPELDLPPDLWTAEVDKGQISEVIHNLVLNAKQAMLNGGSLTVTARNVESPEAGPESGRFVEVAVQDTGAGIEAADLGRIFDPYFTTKPDGHGLGLAVCHSVVVKHGGRLTVDSVPGEGTRFTLLLPAHGAQGPSSHARQAAPPALAGRVLLMDDEEIIGLTLGKMLAALGCSFEFVKDGAAAVSAHAEAAAAGEPFGAIIIDLTVPGGMGGQEAAARIREKDPDVVIYASSGYSTAPVMSDPKKYGFSGALCKPYSLEQVAEALRHLAREEV